MQVPVKYLLTVVVLLIEVEDEVKHENAVKFMAWRVEMPGVLSASGKKLAPGSLIDSVHLSTFFLSFSLSSLPSLFSSLSLHLCLFSTFAHPSASSSPPSLLRVCMLDVRVPM